MGLRKKFFILLICYIIYCSIFIYRTSFVVDGERYFCLWDDVMISMRYAKNFANGYGLVYNPGGERVEGYTNFLWTLYMSLIHLFPIPLSKTSLIIQITGLIFLIANLILVKKISSFVSNNNPSLIMGACFLTASYYGLNYWHLVGTEVSVLSFLVTLLIWRILNFIKNQKIDFYIFIILGISYLVRPDMLLLAIVLLIFLCLFSSPDIRRKNIIIGLLTLLIFVGGKTIFSKIYYDEWLPNSYFLKMIGFPLHRRIAQGILGIRLFFLQPERWIFLSLILILLIFSKNITLILLSLPFFTQLIYSIYVGGDAWEWYGFCNRFIVISMPCWFIIISYSLYLILNRLLISQKTTNLTFYFLIGICFISFNSYRHILFLRRLLLIIPPPENVEFHYPHIKMAKIIEKITTNKAKIGIVAAGALPYFLERECIDFLGRTDKKIAKMSVPKSYISIVRDHYLHYTQDDLHFFREYFPGHMKWDYEYSILELKPDFIAQYWPQNKEIITPFLKDYTEVTIEGFTFWVRKNSNNILWENILSK